MHGPLNAKFTMKILVLYPGTTVSTYHEDSKYYCTHTHGHMPPTSIYSSHHLAAKEDVLAASVECPKCLTSNNR